MDPETIDASVNPTPDSGLIVIKDSDFRSPNTYSRRNFLKFGGAGFMTALLAACGVRSSEQKPQSPTQPNQAPIKKEASETESFRNKVLKFTWEQAKNPEQLKKFQQELADEYIRLTNTTRVKREELIGPNVIFFSDRNSYIQAVRTASPTYQPTQSQWGYTHYESKKVFIDLSLLENQTKNQGGSAGIALLDSLWHEWGHLDVTSSTQGELIDNPSYFITTPDQRYQSIRGAEVKTLSRNGFARFNEVLLETIIVRRMIEQVGLNAVFSSGDYYLNGVDFLAKYTQIAGISIDELYSLYATSNLAELWKRLGSKLPDFTIQNQKITDPLLKGNLLASGINENPQLTQATGVFNLIPQNNRPAQKK